MSDTIAPGDRVSWRLNMGDACGARQFGCVYECKVKRFNIQGDDGVYRVIAAKFITKECG